MFHGQFADIDFHQGCFLGGASYSLHVQSLGHISRQTMLTGGSLKYENVKNISLDYQICMAVINEIYEIELMQTFSYTHMKAEMKGPLCQDEIFWGYMTLNDDWYTITEFSNTSKFAWFTQGSYINVKFDIRVNWSHSDVSLMHSLLENCQLCFSFRYKLKPVVHFPWRPDSYQSNTEYLDGFLGDLFCSHSTCYRLVRKRSYSWEDAHTHCSHLNESLITIKSFETWTQLTTSFFAFFHKEYLIHYLDNKDLQLLFIGLKFKAEVILFFLKLSFESYKQ